MKFRGLRLILCILMVFTVIGCVKDTKKDGYKKDELGVPVEINYIETIKNLEDGTLVIAGEDKNGLITIWDSNDEGASWNKRNINIPKFEGEKLQLVRPRAILMDGQVLVDVIIQKLGDKSGKVELKRFLISKDGIFKEIDIDFIDENNPKDRLRSAQGLVDINNTIQIKSGDIFYIAASEDDIVQIDGKTLKEKKRYVINNSIDSFAIVGNYIVINVAGDLLRVQMNSDMEVEQLDKLEDDIKKLTNVTSVRLVRLMITESEDKVYFDTTSGLLSYDINTEKLEIIEKNSDYLGINIYAQGLIETKDNVFITAINKESGLSLIKYKYGENVKEKPKTEITIYSLMEQQEIRSAISRYNAKNEDVLLRYKIGVTEGSGITEGDAIKTLNTELMAGKGPDILVLDYLPSKSYEKQGVLADVSSSVEKYKNELFLGVVDAYKVKEKIYRLPLEIGIPMILTEKKSSSIGDKIIDINSLEESVKEFNKENPKLITDTPQSPDNFISSIYYMFENKWLGKDNKINEDNLLTFMEASKNIYNICNSKIKEDYDRQAEEKSVALGVTEKLNDYSLNEIRGINVVQPIYPGLIYNGGNLIYGPVKSYSGYEIILTQQIYMEQFYYKVFRKNNENLFIPSFTLGINNNSKNKKIAIKVFEDLVLKNNRYKGEQAAISINKNAFIEAVGVDKEKSKELEFDKEMNRYIKEKQVEYDDDGTEIGFNIYWPNEEDIKGYVAEIDKLNVEPKLDMVLLSEVCNQFTKVINEGLSPEEAVDNVVKNLELYLSE